MNSEVEKGRPTVLVVLAEGASEVEEMLALKKPGALVVRLLQPSKVELTCGKRVVEDAGSPEAEEVTKASVRFTSKSGKSRSGAELLTEAGEEEDEVELVLILKRSHESSSPRRVLQLGLSGRPSIRLMLSEIGP